MVGDGKMRKKLEDNKPDDVTFFGYVEGNRKHELMSRAHAILVPGVREGWGLVVTEANAMGTPAIGYNVHGLRDSIRDGDTGLLCQPNPEAMAGKAIELLNDNDLQKRLSKDALEDSRKFNWDISAMETIMILEKVVNG